ncbi:hypothetical protein R3W88_014651 [Solanum pinnatisectum]|uniref:Uncharacterized protein n=1 Tax=Solanum pinnatisectum TaxID=50273 RepID=A0AAV9KT24_9SOLN|nr:hypothetical protein R3W88_014651 [Solanum pinnatisectum]
MAFKKINGVSSKDFIVATFVDFSDVDPITLSEFKTSALSGFEYFTSLEMARKSKSQMSLKTAILGGNIATKLFDELSHSSFNFGESKIQQILHFNKEQTIEALKKSIDDKNLQITKLMSKIEMYNSRESYPFLKMQENVDIDSPNMPVDSQSAKQFASVATLIVQQLQVMIANTLKLNIATNHCSIKIDHKKDSISEVPHPVVSPKIEDDHIILQFGGIEPVEVSA